MLSGPSKKKEKKSTILITNLTFLLARIPYFIWDLYAKNKRKQTPPVELYFNHESISQTLLLIQKTAQQRHASCEWKRHVCLGEETFSMDGNGQRFELFCKHLRLASHTQHVVQHRALLFCTIVRDHAGRLTSKRIHREIDVSRQNV